MAVKIKSITLWRRDTENRPGTLASALAPLARAGANLRVVMGYRIPGDENRAAVELYPVTGKKSTAAAREAGLSASDIPTLLVEGDDRPGLGHAISRATAEVGINLAFMVAQVIGRRFSAIVGFETPADAKRASGLIKKAAGRAKR